MHCYRPIAEARQNKAHSRQPHTHSTRRHHTPQCSGTDTVKSTVSDITHAHTPSASSHRHQRQRDGQRIVLSLCCACTSSALFSQSVLAPIIVTEVLGIVNCHFIVPTVTFPISNTATTMPVVTCGLRGVPREPQLKCQHGQAT